MEHTEPDLLGEVDVNDVLSRVHDLYGRTVADLTVRLALAEATLAQVTTTKSDDAATTRAPG